MNELEPVAQDGGESRLEGRPQRVKGEAGVGQCLIEHRDRHVGRRGHGQRRSGVALERRRRPSEGTGQIVSDRQWVGHRDQPVELIVGEMRTGREQRSGVAPGAAPQLAEYRGLRPLADSLCQVVGCLFEGERLEPVGGEVWTGEGP